MNTEIVIIGENNDRIDFNERVITKDTFKFSAEGCEIHMTDCRIESLPELANGTSLYLTNSFIGDDVILEGSSVSRLVLNGCTGGFPFLATYVEMLFMRGNNFDEGKRYPKDVISKLLVTDDAGVLLFTQDLNTLHLYTDEKELDLTQIYDELMVLAIYGDKLEKITDLTEHEPLKSVNHLIINSSSLVNVPKYGDSIRKLTLRTPKVSLASITHVDGTIMHIDTRK